MSDQPKTAAEHIAAMTLEEAETFLGDIARESGHLIGRAVVGQAAGLVLGELNRLRAQIRAQQPRGVQVGDRNEMTNHFR